MNPQHIADNIVNYFMQAGATVSKKDYDYVLDCLTPATEATECACGYPECVALEHSKKECHHTKEWLVEERTCECGRCKPQEATEWNVKKPARQIVKEVLHPKPPKVEPSRLEIDSRRLEALRKSTKDTKVYNWSTYTVEFLLDTIDTLTQREQRLTKALGKVISIGRTAAYYKGMATEIIRVAQEALKNEL